MSEKVTIKAERRELHLPAIALRGLVVFPNNLVHFEVGREKSIAAVKWAMANNSNVFLVAQKSMDTTEPQQADLFSYGVVAIPHESKGEQIVLVTNNRMVTQEVLHSYIKNNGMSELYLPRVILFRDKLPVFATGKADNVTLKKEVLEELSGKSE